MPKSKQQKQHEANLRKINAAEHHLKELRMFTGMARIDIWAGNTHIAKQDIVLALDEARKYEKLMTECGEDIQLSLAIISAELGNSPGAISFGHGHELIRDALKTANYQELKVFVEKTYESLVDTFYRN